MISKSIGMSFLFVLIVACGDRTAAQDEVIDVSGTPLEGAGSDSFPSITEKPDPPADGTGVVSKSTHQRGRQGSVQGTYFATFLYYFYEGELVEVDDRVFFWPDPGRESS